jgi:hypothetical protein
LKQAGCAPLQSETKLGSKKKEADKDKRKEGEKEERRAKGHTTLHKE